MMVDIPKNEDELLEQYVNELDAERGKRNQRIKRINAMLVDLVDYCEYLAEKNKEMEQ